ncbi:NADH-quinone oxidoreductase subunit J [Aquipuribacter nitratireducens]|uniref:NADH-quinone oxidoreductase subunit J n=1 Tax=Aquipuribacter nitratireducens TaxID=650104 RepID=A0ABW0GMH4_9MICO
MTDLVTDPLRLVEVVAFWALAALAVVAGVLVFRWDSMARVTYALATSFVAVGLALVVVDLHYIGAVTVLMMVMEMAIMAVFMIMFMGMNPALMPMDMTHRKRPAAVVAVATFVVLAGGALLVPWERLADPVPGAGSASAVGEAVMGPKMLVMMTVSPLLFATLVAGVVLASHRTRYDRLGDDLRRRPADDPQPGGVGR